MPRPQLHESPTVRQAAFRARKIKAYQTDLAQWTAQHDAEQVRANEDFSFQSIRLVAAYQKLAQHNVRYQETLERSLPSVRTYFVTLHMLEWTSANPRPVRPRI